MLRLPVFLPLLTLPLMACSNPAAQVDSPTASSTASTTPLMQALNDDQISNFARLALDGIVREWPNKPGQVYIGPESALTPRQMHPVFYGSFDWHSSVHGHWMLVRLLKQYPDCSVAHLIRQSLDSQLQAEALQAEADYFDGPMGRGFERMYGWAWLLRLATELHGWEDEQGQRWAAALKPLEEKIVELTLSYLPRLEYPIRTGTHPDTAFAMAFALDYARTVGHEELETLLLDRALHYYAEDRDYPEAYEPSGEDFFSSGLNEADLMRRVLSAEEFAAWLERFLPGFSDGTFGQLGIPVEVSDPTDGRLVHLAGLDLSRAWTLQGIAHAFPEGDARRARLMANAQAHADVGLSYVFSGH